MPKIVTRDVTHLITNSQKDTALAVMEEIHAGDGSDQYPRTFGQWKNGEGHRVAEGTIGDKEVTLVVGEVDDMRGHFYRLKTDRFVKGLMEAGATGAVIKTELPEERIAGLANQLAAVIAKGTVGEASQGKRRKKRPGGHARGRAAEPQGGCYPV